MRIISQQIGTLNSQFKDLSNQLIIVVLVPAIATHKHGPVYCLSQIPVFSILEKWDPAWLMQGKHPLAFLTCIAGGSGSS